MKIIRFLGGIGNQMFQYALYKALSQHDPNVRADLNGYKDYSLHNGFEIEQIFDLELNKISEFKSNLYNIHYRKWGFRKLRKLLKLKKAYEEERDMFIYDSKILSAEGTKYYWGYWQNPKYFSNVTDELRKDFQFKKPLVHRNQAILDQIKESTSIALHVRRGDYVGNALLGGLCPEEYYQQSIKLILSKTTEAKFFIFSDDIDWCRNKFKREGNEFIYWNKGAASYIDMQLMSNCKHNIIANSSFSWWAAWLNNYPDKIVIGPEKWVNDTHLNTTQLFPADWIRI